MVVTWGANTIHTFAGAPAPTTPGAFSFGSPAPAPSNGLFGSPALSGGLFGSAPSPFGAAPSGGLFGSSPAPSSSGGLFGAAPAPSGGWFGAAPSPGGLFGTVPAAPPQQQQMPAQAALQAHMDAEARMEEERVRSKLEAIHAAYAGTQMADDTKSATFSLLLYTPLTRELSQQQWVAGTAVDGRPIPVAPPRPLQVSEKDWQTAIVRNPDFTKYMPISAVGAEALQARLTYQQQVTNQCSAELGKIQAAADVLTEHAQASRTRLLEIGRRADQQRSRFLSVMRKVELARCWNAERQRDEVSIEQRLVRLAGDVERLRGTLQTTAQHASTVEQHASLPILPLEDDRQLLAVLKDHRARLASLTTVVQRDVRDLALIQERIEKPAAPTLVGPPPR